MSIRSAVFRATSDGGQTGSKYSIWLHDMLFQPVLRWVTDSLFAAGVRHLAMVRPGNRCDAEFFDAVTSRFTTIIMLDEDAPELMDSLQSFVKESEGDCLFLTDPLLLTAQSVTELSRAHSEGECALTSLRHREDAPALVHCVGLEHVPAVLSHLDKSLEFCVAWDSIYKAGLSVGVCDGVAGISGIEPLFTPQDILVATKSLQAVILEYHLRRGVSVLDSERVIIGPDVIIGRDTLLYPGTILRGETCIGEDCAIGPDVLIDNCVIGSDCAIRNSQVCASHLGDHVIVGPYANIRPHCVLVGDNQVGSFVEIKNVTVGKGTLIPHLSYLGDATVGEYVNIGCGTAIANFDGTERQYSTIGDGAFVGCGTTLISPVKVGCGAFTAAGSTITWDVPDHSLGIARSLQSVKEGWAEGRGLENHPWKPINKEK